MKSFTTISFTIYLALAGMQFGYELISFPSTVTDRINWNDPSSIRAHQPILIAHRGGVITIDAPECSLKAIRLAAQQGYSMVELDIQESKDGIPIVFHDRTMIKACGIDGRICERTAAEVTSIFLYKTGVRVPSDQTICTFEQALALCDELNLGVMLDIKDDGSISYYNSISQGISDHNLIQSTVTIATYPNVVKYLKGKTIFRLTQEEIEKVNYQQDVDIKGKMWFGWPRHITNEMVKEFQKRGALVVPSINVFHYPHEVHMERAFADIQRMQEAGVDAYQIDSAYKDFFSSK